MKKLVVILSVAVVALGGVSIYLWRQLESGRQQIANLETRLQESETRPVRASAVSQVAASVMNCREPPAAEATGGQIVSQSAVAARVSEMTAVLQQGMASPEEQARKRSLTIAMLSQLYPGLGKELNLSAEDADKLFDLMARQQETFSSRLSEIVKDSAASPQEQSARMTAFKQAEEAEVAALLGNKYPQFQEFNETLPMRRQVNDLRAVLGADGGSLSEAQSRSLLAALGAEQKRINQETRDAAARGQVPSLGSQYSPEDQRRLIAAASPHLDPQQLESYRQMLDRQSNQARAIFGGLAGSGGEPSRQGEAPSR